MGQYVWFRKVEGVYSDCAKAESRLRLCTPGQVGIKTLQEFGLWLESEGLQAIATRVSTGDECSIIIEDGYVAGQEHPQPEQKKEWKAGAF